MRDTRFIFVEGIMGAGKSTTAAFLTDHLQRNGVAARFMPEGPTVDEPRHPLRVATDLPHPNAAWRDVTVDDFVERSLQKWRAFVREAQQNRYGASSARGCARIRKGASLWRSGMSKALGRYIVADPAICHGRPRFVGIHILVQWARATRRRPC